MSRRGGQVFRAGLWLAHHFLVVALLILMLTIVAGMGLAWRVAQGPVDFPYLATWLAQAATAEAARQGGAFRVEIKGAALNWEGFSRGVDRPVDIQLTSITLTDAAHGQRVTIPQAEISLGLGALLRGRVEPRAVEIDGASLLVQRTEAGEVSLHVGGDTPSSGSGIDALLPVIEELGRPPSSPAANPSGFRQLRRLLIRDVTVTVADRALGSVWRATSDRIDLRRGSQGGVEGFAEFTLKLGTEASRLKLTGTLDPIVENTPAQLRLHGELAGLAPAALAGLAPALQPLVGIDTVLAGEGDAEFSASMQLVHARLEFRAGPGSATIGATRVRMDGARLTAEGDDRNARLTGLTLRLVGREGGPVSTVSATGAVTRTEGRLRGNLALAIDHADFSDLPALWPDSVAPPARAWVTGNITAGIARDAHVEIGLEVNEDGSGLTLPSATGSLLGEGLTVHWLRPVPPVENGVARLDIVNPDTLEIAITAGRQALASGRPEGGLKVQSGTMRITGILQKDQVGVVDARIAGPIADAIGLLSEKRLHLFDRFPVELKNPAGRLAGQLVVSIPLEDKVRIEQIPIRAVLRLSDAHLAGIAAGHDLDHGDLDLVATADGLKLSGQAEIATIPTTLDADFDFRVGAPAQVQQRIAVSGRPTTAQLAGIGLVAGDALAGAIGVRAVLTERRDGAGDIAVNADLSDARLILSALEWRKEAGGPATASARVRMRRDRVTAIENIVADGTGLVLRGRAAFRDGTPDSVTIDSLVLGRTRAQGSVRFPSGGRDLIEAELSGSVLDLGPVLTRKSEPKSAPPPKTGPAWSLGAQFDRVDMAGGTALLGVTAHARSDGTVIRALDLQGSTGLDAPVRVAIVSDGNGRRLAASAADAGALLRALDVIGTMQGGKLTLDGHFDDSAADPPLAGTATVENFRIRDAPAFGRLLQAMTLYGLVDVLQGEGLGFTRLEAPFRLAGDVLDINGARAFSASLGLTAKGRIDLGRQRVDIQGTVVPAYFFNSLLSDLPVVGKLFSPEPGGGLLAVSYDVRGTLSDPTVRVNPLSILTPGFLRGLFGAF